MKKELIAEITKKLGSVDALGLISKLEALGVEDDALLYEGGISIPAGLVKDLKSLQAELNTLSIAGRAFNIYLVEDRIQIDTITRKSLPQTSSSFSSAMFIPGSVQRLGIKEEHVELPMIPRGSKVLDVGAGTGFIAKKIKDTFACDVHVLEPSFRKSSDFASCVERLGEDHVGRLTLQEALEKFPEKYYQAFDVVCVFKYNVPYKQKEDFIRTLSQVVKPDGRVYVTSVEPERFTFESGDEALYLTEMFRKYFDKAFFVTRRSFRGADQLMTLSGPKLELDKGLSASKGLGKELGAGKMTQFSPALAAPKKEASKEECKEVKPDKSQASSKPAELPSAPGGPRGAGAGAGFACAQSAQQAAIFEEDEEEPGAPRPS